MFSAKSSSDFDDQLAAFTEVAKSFRGKVLFVHIDCDKSDNGRILEFFGLKEEDCPDSRMIEMGKQMQKFKPENSELTQENINAFVSGVLDGSIKRHLMSEAEPEKNDEPVFILTGSNFEKTVYAEDKSVFVEFYAKDLKTVKFSIFEIIFNYFLNFPCPMVRPLQISRPNLGPTR